MLDLKMKTIIATIQVFLMILLSAFSFSVHATNRYVATNGNDSGDCANVQSRCRTIGYAISKMSGGDTLLIGDGFYSSSNDRVAGIPSGSSGNYTTVRAENISSSASKVTINQQLRIARNEQYIKIDGLKFTGNYEDSIDGHHIKITRCAFEGGPVDGNTANLNIGTNNHNDTRYILIEDSTIYGEGGRYKLLIYQTRDVVIRRVVVRPDGGWSLDQSKPGAGYGSTPEAGLSIYNSSNIEVQNVLIFDGMTTAIYNGQPESWTSAFYYPLSGDSPYPSANVRTVGSIAMNNIGESFMYDGPYSRTNITIEHSAAWKPVNATGFVAIGGGISAGLGLSMTNLTLLNIYGYAAANWNNNGDIVIKNSIISNYNRNFYAEGKVVEYYNVCNAGNTCSGTGDKNYDPQQNGLNYLTRVDNGPLKTAGENSSQVGASILNKIGKSGTLYGDSGFNVEQDSLLWPWADEERMRNDLCNGAQIQNRGFCSASNSPTITEYVWGALGNPVPSDLGAMKPPKNPRWIKN